MFIFLSIKLQDECIKHAQEFQKANGLYLAAKETLNVAETNLNSQAISAEWQVNIKIKLLSVNKCIIISNFRNT